MKATAKYRVPKQGGGKVTIPRFMDYFYQFSKKQRSDIATEINQATFGQRWLALDKALPDLNITENEINETGKSCAQWPERVSNYKYLLTLAVALCSKS